VQTRSALERTGAEVHLVGELRRRPRLGTVRRLRQAIASLDPKVVHVNATDQGDAAPAIIAARLARRPTMVTVHVVAPNRAGWRNRLSGLVLRLADLTATVSAASARELESIGIASTVVRNGVSPAAQAPDARGSLGFAPDEFVIGGIGRLTGQKGWDVLVEAAPAVHEQVPHAVIAVIGDGGRAGLEPSARSAGVQLLGHRDDAASLLSAFDLVVCPSRFEGLPLVPMEAMYAGVPIVASDIPSMREVIGDAGVLVPPENPGALSSAIAELAGDPARRGGLAAAGRERAQELFTAERMAADTLAVYELIARA
jgi:glycosyltransferase involved in cell wall biosynthesis